LSLNEYLQKFEEVTGSKWEVVEDKVVTISDGREVSWFLGRRIE